MIAVDTSAFIAILREESTAVKCAQVIAAETDLVISAATLAEALIVARGYGVLPRLDEFLRQIPIGVVAVDEHAARRVLAIQARWGKRNHPASLNFVDCFSYDVAVQHDCPLLYVGNDFAQTDVRSALSA